MNALQFCRRLDSALAKQKGKEWGEYTNVLCAVCGDHMNIYNGKLPPICTVCMEPTGEGECVRVMPLAITRGTLRF